MPLTEIVPFNYTELYTSIETKFSAAGYDISPGSNTTQLITAMAYFTSMLNVNTATNVNELLLSNATQRDNVIADARALGYEIQHKQSYTYTLDLTLSGASTYSIPKYTQFTQGGKTYWYMGAPLSFNQDSVVSIVVKEGTLISYVDYPTSLTVNTKMIPNEAGQQIPQNYVDIPFIDVEENGIEVFVTYYDTFGVLVTNEQWVKSQQLLLDNSLMLNKQFFRMDDIPTRTPRIYFEIGGIGTGLTVGTTVNINVLKTSSVLGAMTPDATGSIDPLSISHTLNNINITAVKLSTQGTNEESITSIKQNAPRFYNSANRAVTTSDYKAFCDRQTTVKDSLVWGGDEEFPKSPGHIWFSFLPSNYVRSLTANDSTNTEFLLQNNFFNDWNYNAVPSADPFTPGLFEAKSNAALAYYSAIYIEDLEIASTQTNSNGQLISPGVWDVLKNYKIPTLQFHHRHPIYVDFEYDITVLKYNIVTSKAAVNNGIFTVIDDFFTGNNDPFVMEKFNVEYFNTSLEKRIDTYLTDLSGFKSLSSASILLTQQNITSENADTASRDIFIPLEVPLETYFDPLTNLLNVNMLPNIDTDNFIDYNSFSITGNTENVSVPASHVTNMPDSTNHNTRIYTDWSGLTPRSSDQIIHAPIRASLSETVTGATSNIIKLNSMSFVPDDPTLLDNTNYNLQASDFSKTTVTVTTNAGISTVLTYGAVQNGYIISLTDTTNKTFIISGLTVSTTDTITVQAEQQCGTYYLFNGINKYITVQLYINAGGFSLGSSTNIIYNTPKSYLYTTDASYLAYGNAPTTYYITTEGYSLTTPTQVGLLTGGIVKTISPNIYAASPLKMDLFRRDRLLKLTYPSMNFKINRNMMPRLKRVTFH